MIGVSEYVILYNSEYNKASVLSDCVGLGNGGIWIVCRDGGCGILNWLEQSEIFGGYPGGIK